MIVYDCDVQSKNNLKEQAINLRREGKTYREIRMFVPVAKSTLSEWFKEVGLAEIQFQRITDLKIKAQKRGAQRKREIRIESQKLIQQKSATEIKNISIRELWLIGIALYWAEGAKQKEHNPSAGVKFSNSDAKMITLFIRWLKECILVTDDQIKCDVYIHENHKYRLSEVITFWSSEIGFLKEHFTRIYFKKNIPKKTYRKNNGVLYNGLLRVSIRASSVLNRRISGWIYGITKNCGIV